MNPEQLWNSATKEAQSVTHRVFSTQVGQRLLLGGLVAVTGLASDSKADWQQAILADQPQAGHTLVLDSPVFQATQQFDPSVKAELPQIQVPTGDFEVIRRGGVELTRIYGENDPDNRLFVQILLQKAATKELAKKIVGEFFLAEPMPKYLDKFTFWVRTSPTPDFNCDIAGNCTNWQPIKDEIDRTHNATGIFSPETIILINNGSLNGKGWLEPYPTPPSIYSYAAVVTTLEAGGPARFLPIIEAAKSILTLSDLWMYPDANRNLGTFSPNCSRTPQIWGWSPTPWRGCYIDSEAYRSDDVSILRDIAVTTNFGAWESTWIDRLIKLFPGNYQYPPFKLHLYRTNPLPGKGFPQGSLDLGFQADIPYGTKNMVIELIPAPDKETGIPNSPGVGPLHITNTEVINKIRREGFILPAPKLGKGPYVQLPGMTYTWRVRVSPDPHQPFQDGPGWEILDATPVLKIPNKGRGEIKDHSAPRDSERITFPVLAGDETTNNLTPTLRWQDGNTDVFYYEVQVSKDPTFNNDLQTATAAVQWNLIHGGQTNPLNSYKAAPLEPGTTYYWRVRPRIQGDGTPAEWSTIASFKTSADARVLQETDWEAMQKDHWVSIVQEFTP